LILNAFANASTSFSLNITSISFSFSPVYFIIDLSDKQIEKKFNYCNLLLKLADVIEPGLSQFRGQLLFELQAVMEHQVKRTCQHGSAEFKVTFSTINKFSQFLEL
jgi:hypothetical protein